MSESLLEIYQQHTLRERIQRIAHGVKAPKDTGEHKYAMFSLLQIFGPSSISLVLSVGMVILAVTYSVGNYGPRKDAGFEVTVMTTESVKLDDIKEEIEKIDQTVEPPPDVVNVPVEGTADVAAPTEVQGSGSGAPGPGQGTGQDSVNALAPVMTRSPLILRGLYGSLYGNRGGGARAGALRAYGGSGAGEDAVLRALRWLKAHQGTDGSWAVADPTDPPAMAGLALLAFLAHNETPSSPEFGQTVEKAMKYLLSVQQQNGMFGPADPPTHMSYRHGICSYAVSEGYALTKVMALKDSMDRAIELIINGQQPQGGFNYGYTKADRFDMSVSGWQFQALKAARMAGCSNPRLEEAINKGIEFIKRQDYNPQAGAFVYADNPGRPAATGPTWTMTGAAVLCLQLLNQGKSPEVRSGLKFLENLTCEWPGAPNAEQKAQYAAADEAAKRAVKAAGDAEGAAKAAAEEKAKQLAQAAQTKAPAKAAVYGWYYVTQAKFQQGGGTWESWNKQFARQLIVNQFKDGHWENGDWSPGPVYTTSFCALMLQVYYRYLPTYKKVEDAPEVKATSDDDVVVDVS